MLLDQDLTLKRAKIEVNEEEQRAYLDLSELVSHYHLYGDEYNTLDIFKMVDEYLYDLQA